MWPDYFPPRPGQRAFVLAEAFKCVLKTISLAKFRGDLTDSYQCYTIVLGECYSSKVIVINAKRGPDEKWLYVPSVQLLSFDL